MVAPTAGWQKGAGLGLGYPTASPEVATRGRARHTGKKMRAGGKWEVSVVRASKFSPPQSLFGIGGEFLPNGGIFRGDSEALSRGEMESGGGHF